MALTYNAALNAATRRKAKLTLCFIPDAPTPVYDLVPARTKTGGYKPETNVSRTPLFADANGKEIDIVTVTTSGGTIAFSTVATAINAVVKKMFLKVDPADTFNHQVLAQYTDGNGLLTELQGVLVYEGEDGDGPTETTMYGWRLEVVASERTLPA